MNNNWNHDIMINLLSSALLVNSSSTFHLFFHYQGVTDIIYIFYNMYVLIFKHVLQILLS